MNIYSIFLFVFLCSCTSIGNKKADAQTSNYITIEELKIANSVRYHFYGSKIKDSIKWYREVPRIECYLNNGKVHTMKIVNYKGRIPDSLDFTELNYFTIENSIIEDNINMFAINNVETLELYNSFFYDSLFDLKVLKNIKYLDIKDSKTNFILNEYFPIEEMRYIEYDSLYPPREIHFDFAKLPKLKALSFKCRNCKIDIPNDSLNLIYEENENGIQISKGNYPIIPNME